MIGHEFWVYNVVHATSELYYFLKTSTKLSIHQAKVVI